MIVWFALLLPEGAGRPIVCFVVYLGWCLSPYFLSAFL